MLPGPSPEFEHLDYRTRWMLYRNTYKAVTVGALVLGVLLAWFTGPALADRFWPNRYHSGVDHVLRTNGLPNGDGYQVEAWRKPNGRVVATDSPGYAGEGTVNSWGLLYWATLLTGLFFGGRRALLPYRRRLGLDPFDCGLVTMWGRDPAQIWNRPQVDEGPG